MLLPLRVNLERFKAIKLVSTGLITTAWHRRVPFLHLKASLLFPSLDVTELCKTKEHK